MLCTYERREYKERHEDLLATARVSREIGDNGRAARALRAAATWRIGLMEDRFPVLIGHRHMALYAPRVPVRSRGR